MKNSQQWTSTYKKPTNTTSIRLASTHEIFNKMKNGFSVFAQILTGSYKNSSHCRQKQATAIQRELAPLPAFRFSDDKTFPFQQTGLDIFQPIASKTARNL